MNQEEKILALFDEYFEFASKEEIESDIAYVNSIGFSGISFNEYIEALNIATAYSLRDNSICDDIAFADMFNNSIMGVEMGNNIPVKTWDEPLPINVPCKNCDINITQPIFSFAA